MNPYFILNLIHKLCLRFSNLFPDVEPGMFVKGVSSRNYVMRTKLMSDRLLKEGHEVRR